jgi:hypothetical protein
MTLNWSQEKYDCSTRSERKAERQRQLRAHPESLVSKTTSQTDHALIDREETELRSSTGHPQWKMWFVCRGVMLAALAGATIFFFLNVANLGVLGSALTMAGVVAAVGLGHYLLWGRVFVRRTVRERQHIQERGTRSEISEAEPPDEFPLGLNEIARLAEAANPFQAHIWQQALQEEGIRCQVLGDYLEAGIGDIPGMGAEVWVEAADLARAEAILDQHRGRSERAGQPEESPQVPGAHGSKSDTWRATQLSRNRCGGE